MLKLIGIMRNVKYVRRLEKLTRSQKLVVLIWIQNTWVVAIKPMWR